LFAAHDPHHLIDKWSAGCASKFEQDNLLYNLCILPWAQPRLKSWRGPHVVGCCMILFLFLLPINSWPTFSPYLYNRVWSELTCRKESELRHVNSLSHSRLACSRLSAHIEPSVNNPRRQTRPTLVYSTVDSGLTITSPVVAPPIS